MANIAVYLVPSTRLDKDVQLAAHISHSSITLSRKHEFTHVHEVLSAHS